MFTTYFTAGLALVASAVAYTQPTTGPEGNAIYNPGLNAIVPAGKPYEITWNHTTDGTITLVLLKGPSANAVPQYAIAENLINSGYHSWTVAADLGDANSDGTGYGIQLIVDATGQYQYSTQFGIQSSGASSGSSSSSSVASSSEVASSTEASSSITSSTEAPASTTASSTAESSTLATLPHISQSAGYYPTANSTTPTKSAASSGAFPSSTGVPKTNGAGTVATSFAGLVVAAGVAVFAL